jgi:hypothetical protein
MAEPSNGAPTHETTAARRAFTADNKGATLAALLLVAIAAFFAVYGANEMGIQHMNSATTTTLPARSAEK